MRPKQLITLWGEPLIVKTLKACLDSGLSEVLVVLGHMAKDIAKLISHMNSPKLKVLYNPSYERGISTSIREGVSNVMAGSQGIMVILGDTPFLTREAIDTLIEEFKSHNKGALSYWENMRPVHPVIFHASLRERLLQLTGDKGAREILKELEAQGLFKKLPLPEELKHLGTDIDTPEDLKRVLEFMKPAPQI